MPEPSKQTESVSSPGVANVPPSLPVPAPDPNAPPTPPAPAALPATPPKPSFRSIDDDLGDFAKGDPAPPAKGPKKAQEPPKPPDEPPAPDEPGKPPTAPEGAPEGEDDYLGIPKPKAQEPPKLPEEPPTGPMKAPELRAAYAKVKDRLAEAEKELSSYKTGGKPIDEGERKAYVTEIEGLKKQISEADTALKSVAYEQSSEFKQKYQKPFMDTWNEGVKMVQGLKIQDGDGNVRQATPEDFTAIMQIQDHEQAATTAQEMFGANAFYVLSQRMEILKANNARAKAMEEFQSTLSEREKAQMEQMQKTEQEREAQRTQSTALFRKFNSEAAEKHPEFFAPVDGDDDGNALLEKGYREADLAFSGAAQMTPEKRIRLHSAIRNKAAAFSRLVHKLRSKDAEVESLKAELDEMKGSTPGPGQVGREDRNPNRRLTADEEIESAARYDR